MTEGLPSTVSTDQVLMRAETLEAAPLYPPDKSTAVMLRTLVSERDALAVRVRELEAALREAQRQLNADAPNCALDTIDAALTTTESKP